VLAARRTERIETLARELPGSLAVTTDVTIAGHVERLVARTVDTYGRVDILRSGGSIVNVSSATSLRVFAGLGGYSATKAALNMLSQVGRLEFASATIAVSVVYPSVTATEFHQRLRAGHLVTAGRSITPDPPELVGQAIAMAISTGTPHVLVADPPKAIEPGDSEGWGVLLARQAPRAPQTSAEAGSESSVMASPPTTSAP
jgi:NADP-dependent 3-hydroxy acid dehydrogenase YdfG